MEGVARGEHGTLNCATVVWLAENSIFRLRKSLGPGSSETSIKGVPIGYYFHGPRLTELSFLIFGHSLDPTGRRKEDGSVGQNGGQRADG